MCRLLAALALVAAIVAQPPAPRAIVVIGDLHMGPGRDASGEWYPTEDFRWQDEFAGFLGALDAEGGDTDLVINGDLFELLQSPSVPCRHADRRLGCTPAEAAERLQAAMTAHRDELAAIGAFAARRANRVYVLAGDHDAALLVPEVWTMALASFAAPAGRIALAAPGTWRSPDGKVHVEHGHQLPLSADRFAAWPNPVVTVAGRRHIERPWGEQVIVPLYDRVEATYPIVDNIAEEGAGAKLVAAADPDAVEDAAGLLRFLLTKTTWQQFRMDLDDGEVQAPAWDVARIRGDLGGFLAASLPSDDPFAASAKTASAAGLASAAAPLDDREIVAICDYRAAIRRARRRMERVLTQLSGVGAPMPECPRMADTVGPAFEYYWRSRDQQVGQHIPDAKMLDAIVFGHTHLLDRAYRPFGEEGPQVVTSGAWQRTVHPNDVKQIDAPLTSLPACYPYLQVPAAAGTRIPQARAWARNEQGRWAINNRGC